MGMEVQECHSHEEFKPFLLAFRKNDESWKWRIIENSDFMFFLVASQEYITEWLQCPGWHLGVHEPSYT